MTLGSASPVGIDSTTAIRWSADTDAFVTSERDDVRVRLTRSGALAAGCLVLTVAAEVATLVLAWDLKSSYDTIIFAVYNITVCAVGTLIVVQLPSHPVGWILCLGGLQGAATSDLAIGWGLRAASEGLAGASLAQWIGLVAWCPGALMWVLALLYIPTGRLVSPRWRVCLGAALLGMVLYVVGWWISPTSINIYTHEPNRYAVDWLPGAQMAVTGGLLLNISAIGALASLIIRFRSSDAITRQQLKWVALGGAVLVVLLPVGVALWSVSPVVRGISPLALSTATVALGAAVLRYRLFDIDRIMLRALAYVLVSIVVVVSYAATAVSLGAVAGGSSSWQVAAATLVAAVVFGPALRALRQLVDARFDREGHQARLGFDRYLERLRAGTEQPDRIEQVLRDALSDQELTLLLFLPASGHFADLRGQLSEVDTTREVVRIERSGVPEAVVMHDRRDDLGFSARVRRLVEHGRLAVQVARLGVELSRQLDELARSRQRIAVAADEERRRIQRDLHDGAQQRLVTIGIALRGIEGRLRSSDGNEDADRLDGLVADLATTIEELRSLTDRLPLPQLDSGIAAAFRELAERAPIPVVVEVDHERLDPALEATAYFVGCEGLTNTLKHARATVVTLRAVRSDGSLFVSVADDGVGGARTRAGSGLAGLADRVAAGGGRLHVESGTGGTLLTAELPCG